MFTFMLIYDAGLICSIHLYNGFRVWQWGNAPNREFSTFDERNSTYVTQLKYTRRTDGRIHFTIEKRAFIIFY